MIDALETCRRSSRAGCVFFLSDLPPDQLTFPRVFPRAPCRHCVQTELLSVPHMGVKPQLVSRAHLDLKQASNRGRDHERPRPSRAGELSVGVPHACSVQAAPEAHDPHAQGLAACDSDLTQEASFDAVGIEFNRELEKHGDGLDSEKSE